MEPVRPRVSSVMGVARALLATIDLEDTVEVLVSEFGWDVTFQALSRLRGRDAERAFAVVWEQLLTGPIRRSFDPTVPGWE